MRSTNTGHLAAGLDAGHQRAEASPPSAPPGGCAKQALDPKHHGPGRLEGEPLPEQLRRRVDALRVRRVVFDVRARGASVEDEVAGVVDEHDAGGRGGPGEGPHRERVHVECGGGIGLGAIHVVVRGAIDDEVGAAGRHGVADGAIVGDVERRPRERRHVRVAPEHAGHGAGELARRAGDEHPPSHQAARFVPATKAFIFSSSNTPSQRATTAVEMQLPITFTAVRPMSIT